MIQVFLYHNSLRRPAGVPTHATLSLHVAHDAPQLVLPTWQKKPLSTKVVVSRIVST